MRIELSGSFSQLDPIILEYTGNQSVDYSSYITLGYTHYDVICIGGAGGQGGGINTAGAGTTVRNFGGAGGGGGFHRVKGLLASLPASVPIVVGTGGALGTEDASNPANTTDGGDGGASSFNGTTCRASGGKGGKRSQSNSTTVTTQAHGGQGGVGDSTTAGGGAAGGTAGTPTDTGPGTPGVNGTDGTLINDIGQGGGGGAGGVGKFDGTTCVSATSGGRGAFNPGDTSVYGMGLEPGDDSASTAVDIQPGGAGGAKATPLNEIPTIFGQSNGERLASSPGIVVVRLTAE